MSGFWASFLANIVTFLLLGLIPLIAYCLTRRAALRRFFGLTEAKSITVYLARLRILTQHAMGRAPGGPSGCANPEGRGPFSAVPVGERPVDEPEAPLTADGEWISLRGPSPPVAQRGEGPSGPRDPWHGDPSPVSRTVGVLGADGVPRSYLGPAVPLAETELAPYFQRLFNAIVPGTDTLPWPLRSLLLPDVDVKVQACPGDGQEVSFGGPTVCVGSPAYNLASGMLEARFAPLASFTNDHAAIGVLGSDLYEDPSTCFVQRMVDATPRQVVFYVAGITTTGTKTAGYYLVKEWKYLAKKFRKCTKFCVILRTRTDDFGSYEVLSELGR